MARHTRARAITRHVIDGIALLIVGFAIVSIDALPSWLPFLLILTAGALAYLGRRVVIADRHR